ncbi:MAG TPA: PQQ-binding-like beta-propeller repeat protein, partial [Acidobacteriota bacterium]|nr:PQQ-binding-like beta-propeller repeat protein [Acidobacteriota bacterium]
PGVVLVEDWEGNLMAYEVATGKELWPKPIFTGSVQHVTLDDVAENTLLARPGESSEWFLAYNATTGEKLWEQKTDDLNRTFWLYTHRGVAYVESTQAGTRFNSPVTLNTRLAAYDLKSGKKLWHILNYDLGNVVCFEDVILIGMKSEVFAVKAGQ